MKASRRARVPVDPVTRYATCVDRGEVLAGRWVRLACRRHLDDLTRRKGFPYHFEPARVAQFLAFFRDFLTLDDGQPFALMPWQVFVFGSLEGWVDAQGHRRFQTCYAEVSKGSGKTPGAAAYGLYCLAGKGERSAEIYSLGVDAAQANYLWRFAKRMAERSDDLRGVLEVGEHNIAYLSRDAFFRPLSAEGRSLDNKRPYLAVLDELHEHPSSVIADKMRLGFKGREDALLLEITNSGHDKTSVCWQHHDYSTQVLEGAVRGASAERWFAYICQLDPCEPCRDAGATQPNDGCAACDTWTDPRVWPKVQPSLGVTIRADQMQALVDEALDRPDLQARTKRLTFCQWTQAHTIWIPFDRWEACRSSSLATSADRRPCAVGFDMSEKLDLTACAIALRVEDRAETPSDIVELDEVDNGQTITKSLNINFCVDLRVYFWLPAETLAERVRNEHIPFDTWARDGWLRVTPGPVIDYDLIYDQFCQDLAPPYRPDRIGYDKHNATQFALQLRDKARFTVVDVPQGRALSESFKLFEALVRLKRIRHDGNPVMAWCVSNASPKHDRYENVWLEKPSATKRIDGVIASVIALSQLVLIPATKKRRGRALLFTSEGFKPAIPETPLHAG